MNCNCQGPTNDTTMCESCQDALDAENPNEGVLEGMKCPKCGSFGPFDIEVSRWITVEDSGDTDDEGGDTEWEEANPCKCNDCDMAGTVADFTEKEPEPPFDPKRNVTRNQLMDLIAEHRIDNWDQSDTWEDVMNGRIGLVDLSNADLEELANSWLEDEDGRELEYHITDADTSKPSAETINAELLDQLREAQRLLGYHMPDKFDDAIHEANWTARMNAIQAAIAKAEGR